MDYKIKTHVFREEQKSKHISPKKFAVRPKYQTPQERLEAAKADASTLLSNGVIMSTRKPFEFRAPEPLKSTSQGFHFNPITEQERIGDTLRQNVLFENEQFDRNMMVREDLFRTTSKKRWVSPRDFSVTTRKTGDFGTLGKQDSQRAHSTIRSAANRSTFNSHRGQSFCFGGSDPFEDPKMEPEFVRTTKEYLKTLHIKNVHKEIKREEKASYD